ncbi:NACHT, LRR and PYD domains-containing protein 12-like isoform X1 [Triplophysa rosa]|uniref:NACHT n=2 Tax=Triplophysa rosa TaxID=992332 RepID=A0A9W7T6P9_TRIRA|nr:NACHT, LRR and PYD domains-containing protein 12-like isoform X1 [Triplophysa rosa]XP_057184285.1 NACHT, LRR and PYD domains-containing protein 12-like isoform X1 [Triplophysa rosa]XP_057184286.1 NACHT, LRR and PYD domains-containing protein 12-like isoform X1 [Triplophysa rosa]KAI7790582.1 putative NACHT [Triplophysa rosa]
MASNNNTQRSENEDTVTSIELSIFSLVQREDSDIFVPHVSMKSNQSMGHPYNLSNDTEVRLVQQEDSDVFVPHAVSMKSNQSMGHPYNLSNDTEVRLVQREDSDFVPRAVSMKSNQSMGHPYNLSNDTEVRTQQKELSSKISNEDLIWIISFKQTLKNRYQCIFEGNEEHRSPALLNNIYTELYITDAGSSVNAEHEIRQIETVSNHPSTWDTPIPVNGVFKGSAGSKPIQTVLTKGIAGIGKTVSVQKFTLDWAEDKANQDIHMIFPLPFRELNRFKKEKVTLIQILQHFYDLKIEANVLNSGKYRSVFIFDGLDECRFPLDFQKNKSCSSVTEAVSIGALLTNLICKNLLPSSQLWITSRPAAIGQIPPDLIDQLTEVRGFNDSQKEEYFAKRISDPDMCHRIILHLKSSRILHVMCHIPVFCWISATVLEGIFGEFKSREMPKTLTQMYAHFLIFQTKQMSHKYDVNCKADFNWDSQSTLLLGKLAFQQLEKGNLLFYEDDLRECGVDPNLASVFSGLCTQIFREEAGLHQERMFSFFHASIQEFLAAFYAFLMFVNSQQNVLSHKTNAKFESAFKKPSMHEFLKFAVDKALASDNGHLDLLLRFLLGLSLVSNQTLLQPLLTETWSDPEGSKKTLRYIKEKIRFQLSAEKAISLFHFLSELKDDSLVEEVQEYLKSGGFRGEKLSPSHCSALAYTLLISAEELDVFNLTKCIDPRWISDEGLLRLLPVIKASRLTLLRLCNVTEKVWKGLSSVLSLSGSCMRELDLSSSNLNDTGIYHLVVGLGNPQCKLEVLRLFNCSIGEDGCASLASALRSNPSHLKELDLTHNQPHDTGVKMLSDVLANVSCKLETLRFMGCELTRKSCAALAEALQSTCSSLKHLDLSLNCLEDSGVKLLCAGLKNPLCKLETLSLSDCEITAAGCSKLASALESNPSHLRVLDLSLNDLTDTGVTDLLPVFVNLDKLWLNNCNLTERSCHTMAYADPSKCSKLRELNLNANAIMDFGLKHFAVGLCNLLSSLQSLSLTYCSVTEQGCAFLASAIRSNYSQLRELDLRGNKLSDSGAKLLTDLLEDPKCKLETLALYPDIHCDDDDES